MNHNKNSNLVLQICNDTDMRGIIGYIKVDTTYMQTMNCVRGASITYFSDTSKQRTLNKLYFMYQR